MLKFPKEATRTSLKFVALCINGYSAICSVLSATIPRRFFRIRIGFVVFDPIFENSHELNFSGLGPNYFSLSHSRFRLTISSWETSLPFLMSSSLISNIIFCSSLKITGWSFETVEETNLSRASRKSLFWIERILSINSFLILSTVAIGFLIYRKYPKKSWDSLMLYNGLNKPLLCLLNCCHAQISTIRRMTYIFCCSQFKN